MNICPQCGYQNWLGVLVCDECGATVFDDLFAHTHVVAHATDDPGPTTPLHQTGYLLENSTILLQVEDAPPIKANLETPMILGRMNNRNLQRPDIDLTAYRAFEKGVSSRHALLGCEEGRVKIADLGSTNGTFVYAERLVPHQPHLIRHGDELRLGKLLIRVCFVVETERVEYE